MKRNGIDFNEDLIECINYLLEEQHKPERFWISQEIFKEKWGKERGYDLETVLSYNEALTRNGTKIKIVTPVGIRLREETQLRIINKEQINIQKEQQKSQKWATAAMWNQVIVTFFIMIITIILGVSNLRFQAEGLKITSNSIIPNAPNLKISGTDYVILSQSDLVNEKEIKSYARVCVTNNGRLDSGNINLKIINSTLLEASDNIENIKGGDIKCLVLALRDKCLEKSIPNKCTKANTKIGKNKFSILAECANCIENKFFNKDFYFCKYDNNLSICN